MTWKALKILNDGIIFLDTISTELIPLGTNISRQIRTERVSRASKPFLEFGKYMRWNLIGGWHWVPSSNRFLVRVVSLERNERNRNDDKLITLKVIVLESGFAKELICCRGNEYPLTFPINIFLGVLKFLMYWVLNIINTASWLESMN